MSTLPYVSNQFLNLFSAESYNKFREEYNKCICAKWKNYTVSGSKVGRNIISYNKC